MSKTIMADDVMKGLEFNEKKLRKLYIRENGKKVAPIKLGKTALITKAEFKKIPEDRKSDYEFDRYTGTYRVIDKIWAKCWREHGPWYRDEQDARYIKTAIGGSDIAKAYDGSWMDENGFLEFYPEQHGNQYGALNELIAQKQGKTMAGLPAGNDFILYCGHLEEDAIRLRLTRDWLIAHPEDTIEVINDTQMYQAGYKDDSGALKYPFMVCDLDGIVSVNGLKGVLECKTVSFTSPDYDLWKKGIVPLKYYLQCVYYMACCNLPYAIICVKWGISESDFRYVVIERNFDVEREVLMMAEEVVEAIESDKDPEYDNQESSIVLRYYRRRFGEFEADKPSVVLEGAQYVFDTTELKEIVEQEKELTKKAKELKARRIDLILNLVKASNGANEVYIPLSDGTYTEVALKKPKQKRFLVDEDKVKELYPSLYERYSSVSLNITNFLKENPGLFESVKKDYTITDAACTEASIKVVSEKLVKIKTGGIEKAS